jgi:hypothetical protein
LVKICGKKQYSEGKGKGKGKGKNDQLFLARYNGDVTVTFVSNDKTNGRGFSLLLNRDTCRSDCMGVCDGSARLLCNNPANCIGKSILDLDSINQISPAVS